MKRNKALSALAALIMTICLVLALTSCKDDTTDPAPTPSLTGPATYTVALTSEYGLPLSGVYVLIHDEASSNPNSSVGRAETDRDGKVSFELEQSATYSVRLLDPPAGYLPEEKYFFDNEHNATVTVASAPITDGSASDVDEYSVGDVIHDITMTDINGNTQSVSGALEESELLILNFWFASCGPCKEEFPHFISAYERYAEEGVEIFGINDNGEPIGVIRDFTVTVDGEAVSLPFPTFKADSEENGFGRCELISKFGGTGYPTTVFVDRAGVICYIHYGQLSATQLNALIEHFTGEDYEQALGNDVWN